MFRDHSGREADQAAEVALARADRADQVDPADQADLADLADLATEMGPEVPRRLRVTRALPRNRSFRKINVHVTGNIFEIREDTCDVTKFI